MNKKSEKESEKKSLIGFLAGILFTQFVNSALHLAQPILLAQLSSMGEAALFSSFDTAVHMFGTYVGGWPVDRYGAKRVLVVATALRGLALAAVPVAMLTHHLTLMTAMIWYTVDASVRGFVDTSVHTLPLDFSRHDSADLDRVNSRYEFMFELGGFAGPICMSALMIWVDDIAVHILIPAGFLLAAAAFTIIPVSPARTERTVRGGTWSGFKTIVADRSLLIICLGFLSFSVYPLRKLMAASFAKTILADHAKAGFVGAAFALGGLLGATAYARLSGDGSRWIVAGAAGMILLATGWYPESLWWMMIAVFIFALTNTGARLTLTRARQVLTPLEISGGVTAASQFGANAVSVLLKALMGAAFALTAGPRAAFWAVGMSLAALALCQLALARMPLLHIRPADHP